MTHSNKKYCTYHSLTVNSWKGSFHGAGVFEPAHKSWAWPRSEHYVILTSVTRRGATSNLYLCRRNMKWACKAKAKHSERDQKWQKITNISAVLLKKKAILHHSHQLHPPAQGHPLLSVSPHRQLTPSTIDTLQFPRHNLKLGLLNALYISLCYLTFLFSQTSTIIITF